MEILKAFIFGIVEGITEWLPISSTGHMIILDEMIHLNQSSSFINVFLVVIQLGAILAVILLFWDTLWPFQRKEEEGTFIRKDRMILWGKILIACIPAAVVGIFFDHVFEKLFYHAVPVALALIIFGVAFIIVEKKKENMRPVITTLEQLDMRTVLIIGVFQLIAAVFPGTSRSGATILGALLIGVSRTVAAEFTFCLAVPVMAGASLLKIIQYGFSFTETELTILVVGMLTAFVVSIVVIRFLMDFIKKHDFRMFGWYRILLGGIVILLYLVGVIQV